MRSPTPGPRSGRAASARPCPSPTPVTRSTAGRSSGRTPPASRSGSTGTPRSPRPAARSPRATSPTTDPCPPVARSSSGSTARSPRHNPEPASFRLNGTACNDTGNPHHHHHDHTTTPTPASFSNPVVWQDFADIDIIRVDDAYYYSASTMHYSPGAPILRSYDLVNWEFAGHSVPRLDFGAKYDLNGGTGLRPGNLGVVPEPPQEQQNVLLGRVRRLRPDPHLHRRGGGRAVVQAARPSTSVTTTPEC